jgi:hypothetical protein
MPPCNLKMASRQSPVSIIGFVATRNKPRRDRLAEFEKYRREAKQTNKEQHDSGSTVRSRGIIEHRRQTFC